MNHFTTTYERFNHPSASRLLPILAFALVLLRCVPASAGESVIVPKAVEEIINPHFRNVLENHARNFNALTRDDQIRAFVQVYKSLNYGQMPAIAPDDTTLPATEGEGQAPQSANRAFQSSERSQYYEGYGYKRVPPLPSPVPAAASFLPIAPVVRTAKPQTPPPYARPFVAEPKHAEQVHAGP